MIISDLAAHTDNVNEALDFAIDKTGDVEIVSGENETILINKFLLSVFSGTISQFLLSHGGKSILLLC